VEPNPELETTRHGGDDVARELHALGAQIASLQTEVRRLQGANAALPSADSAGWEPDPPASFQWLSSLDAPRRAAVRVPRLPFELAFLGGAAALAGAAHLRPVEIAGVMGGAWVIVALAEWAGSHADRLRHQLMLAAPARDEALEPVSPDPAWFSPPVEHTLLTRPGGQSGAEQETAVGRLPSASDPETTVVRRSAG
jgi:hypothetical protein